MLPNSLSPSEQQLLNVICEFLTIAHLPFVHIRNTGTMIKYKDRLIFGKSKFNHRGASDLIVLCKGKGIAVEVKTKKGIVSDYQKAWLQKWTEEGGISVVARSLDDVIDTIEKVRRCQTI